MREFRIGVGRDSKPSSDQVALLSKLNIDPSAFTLDEPSQYGRWSRLMLPDDPDFTVEQTGREISTTTISYKGVSVFSINEKHALWDNWVYFSVSEENINKLEQEGKLPEPASNVQKNVHEYQKTRDREEQYRLLEREFDHTCFEYVDKLKGDLKKYAIVRRDVGLISGYNKPSAENPLDLLAWQKLQIVEAAKKELSNTSRSPSENMSACLDKLKEPGNVAILVQRRDSWLMAGAKVVGTLGTILIYRAMMGDQVTKGIKNTNLLAERYHKLKDSEDKGLGSQASPSSPKA